VNGWTGTQFWFSTLVVGMAFYGLVARLLTGGQFVTIVTIAAGVFGIRKAIEHRKDNPRIPAVTKPLDNQTGGH